MSALQLMCKEWWVIDLQDYSIYVIVEATWIRLGTGYEAVMDHVTAKKTLPAVTP